MLYACNDLGYMMRLHLFCMLHHHVTARGERQTLTFIFLHYERKETLE